MSQNSAPRSGGYYSSPSLPSLSFGNSNGGSQHGCRGIVHVSSPSTAERRHGGIPPEPGLHTLRHHTRGSLAREACSSDLTSSYPARHMGTPTSPSAGDHRVTSSPCDGLPSHTSSFSSRGSFSSHRSSVDRASTSPIHRQSPTAPPVSRPPRWIDLQDDGDGEHAFCLRSVVLGMEVALLSDRVQRCSDGVLDTAGERTWLSLLQAYNLYQRNTVDLLNHLLLDAQSRLDRVLTYYRRQETSSSISSRMRDSTTSEPCLTGQPLSSQMEGNPTAESHDRGARPRGTVSGAVNLHTLARDVSRSEVHRELVPRYCREEEEVFVHQNTCRSFDHSPRCSDRHTVASAGECASVHPVHSPDESFSGASSAVFGVSSSSRGSFSSIEEKAERRTRACNSSIGSEQESVESREEGHQTTRAGFCDGRGGEDAGETTRPCQVSGICSPSPCLSPCEGSTRAGPSQSSSVVSPSYKALSPESLASMESEFSSWLRGSEGMERSKEKMEGLQCSGRGEAERVFSSGEGRGDRRRDLVVAEWRNGGQENDSASEDDEEGFCPSVLDHLEHQIASEEESDKDGFIRDEEEEDHPLRVRRSIASVITTEFVDPSSDEEEEEGIQTGGEGRRNVRTTSSAAEEKWWRVPGGSCSQGSELGQLECREGEHQGSKEDGEASSNEEEQDGPGKSNESVAEMEVKEESALQADAGVSGASTNVPAGSFGDRACQRMRRTNGPRHRGSCPPCSRRPRVQTSQLRRHSVQPIFLPAAWRRRAISLIHQSRGFQTSTSEMISSPVNTYDDLRERLLTGGPGDGLVEMSLCRVQQHGEDESYVQSRGVQSPSGETSTIHRDKEDGEPATADGRKVFSCMKEGLAYVLSLHLRENQLKWELLYRDQLAFVHFHESSQRRRQRGLELLHAHQTACASFSSIHPLLPNRTYSSSQQVSSSHTLPPPSVAFTRPSDSFPSSSPPRVMHASGRNPAEEPSRNRRPAALHPDLATSASSSGPVCVPSTPRGRRGTESYLAASGFPSCFIDNANAHSTDTPDYRFLPQDTSGVPYLSPLPTGVSPGSARDLCPSSLSATAGRSCEAPLGGEGGLQDSRGCGNNSLRSDGCEFSSGCAGLSTISAQPNVLSSHPSPALYSGSAPVVSTVPAPSLHASSPMACDRSGAFSSVTEAVSLERTPAVIYRSESVVEPQASGSSSSARADESPVLYLALSPLPTSGPASPINCQSLQRSEEPGEGERREGPRGEGESLFSFSQHPVVTRDTIGGIPPPPVWVREEEDPEDAIAFAQAAAIAARGGRGDSQVGERDRAGGGRNIVGNGRRGENDDGTAVPMCSSSSWIENNAGLESTPGSLPMIDLGRRGTPTPPSIQVTSPSSPAPGNFHHTTNRSSGVPECSSSLSLSPQTPHLLGGRPISPRHSLALDPTPLTCVSAASGTCRETSTAFEISQFATSADGSSSPLVNSSPFPGSHSSSSPSRDIESSSSSSPPLSAPQPLPHGSMSCFPSSYFSQNDSSRHSHHLRSHQEQSPRNPERTRPSQDIYGLPSSSTPPSFPYSSSLPSTSSPSAVFESAIPTTNTQTHRTQNGQSGERDAMRLLHSPPSYQSTPENVYYAGRQRQAFSSEVASQDCPSAAQICLQHRDIFERQLRKNEAHLEGLRVLMNRLLVVMEQIGARDSTSN
ncbi:hypothetical protein CSUI_005430 [Cystoisospora suis]|uniref:Uncharacterized protein n=1 Tax=Cystoisospora suis TaxID=483139 RepID=A0A2C6KV79_9APIC|nr:hypothetical protein CSUI_005430 [Cystoisospora suis]